jgi:hypothetical protein
LQKSIDSLAKIHSFNRKSQDLAIILLQSKAEIDGSIKAEGLS